MKTKIVMSLLLSITKHSSVLPLMQRLAKSLYFSTSKMHIKARNDTSHIILSGKLGLSLAGLRGAYLASNNEWPPLNKKEAK